MRAPIAPGYRTHTRTRALCSTLSLRTGRAGRAGRAARTRTYSYIYLSNRFPVLPNSEFSLAVFLPMLRFSADMIRSSATVVRLFAAQHLCV